MQQPGHPDLKLDFAEGAEPSFAEIMAALDAHELWLSGETKGKRLTSENLPVEVKNFNFDGRNLSRSQLTDVWFISCCMRGVDWTEADVSGSSFTDCDLSEGVRFDRANLQECWFKDCPGVETASFEGADLWLAEVPGVTPPGNSPREVWLLSGKQDVPELL